MREDRDVGRCFKAGKAVILSAVLAAVMVFAAAADPAGNNGAPETAMEKSRDNTWLGTSGISNPDLPADRDAPWSGSFVYFGTYDGRPIRFRVLAKDSTVYTPGKSLFLDSDEALFTDHFDTAEPCFNAWDGSSIQGILNGPFLEGFTAPEQAAVAFSTGSGGIPVDPEAWGPPVSVNDKVFLLDVAEVQNESYGYTSDKGGEWRNGEWYSHTALNRQKTSGTHCWVLRTASSENSELRGWHVLEVSFDGGICTKNAANAGVYFGSDPNGIAPALNVSQESILFSSRTGTGANEFKLTLLDENLTVGVPDGRTVSSEGAAVTVPFAIGGTDAGAETRASVLILDREYVSGNGNGAAIIRYMPLRDASDDSGAFDLPAGCGMGGWGTDYYVYLLAENLNGAYESDYASLPVPLNPPGSVLAAGELRAAEENGAVSPMAPKDGSNTGLCTSCISAPVPGDDPDTAWSGNYVYFGTYCGRPIRFRVLAKDSTAYTPEAALFLDSDESLFTDCYDRKEPHSGSWEDSSIRDILNNAFLEGFSRPEQAAIAVSTGDGGRAYAEGSPEAKAYGAPVPVNDRVFLPDVADVTNAAYGYSPDLGWKLMVLPKNYVPNRVKVGRCTYWWLRSAVAGDAGSAGYVHCEGLPNSLDADYRMGVAPAVNIDQKAVLFSTAIGEGTDEFKLTLIDSDLAIMIPDHEKVTAEGTAVTVPYRTEGADAGERTRASVLILDKEYTPGNTNGAVIIAYQNVGSGTDGRGAFALPAGYDPDGWGTDYHVYILAENINDLYESDYASVPVPVNRP